MEDCFNQQVTGMTRMLHYGLIFILLKSRVTIHHADYQCHVSTTWMQVSMSMHKSPSPVRHSRMNQARLEEEEKRETEKTEARKLMGRKTNPTKQKHIWGTKTRPTYAQLRLTKLDEERQTSLSHRMRPHASLLPHIVGGLFREYRRYIIFLEPDFEPFSSFSNSGRKVVICEVSGIYHRILYRLFIFALAVSNPFFKLWITWKAGDSVLFLSHQAHQ